MPYYIVLVKMSKAYDFEYVVKAENPSAAFKAIKEAFSDKQGHLNPTIILGQPELLMIEKK